MYTEVFKEKDPNVSTLLSNGLKIYALKNINICMYTHREW